MSKWAPGRDRSEKNDIGGASAKLRDSKRGWTRFHESEGGIPAGLRLPSEYDVVDPEVETSVGQHEELQGRQA